MAACFGKTVAGVPVSEAGRRELAAAVRAGVVSSAVKTVTAGYYTGTACAVLLGPKTEAGRFYGWES